MKVSVFITPTFSVCRISFNFRLRRKIHLA